MSDAERARRYRQRQAADRRLMAEVRFLFDTLGYLRVPDGVTRDEWEAFVDREERRRVRAEALHMEDR